jgi:hypothetical protein
MMSGIVMTFPSDRSVDRACGEVFWLHMETFFGSSESDPQTSRK